MTRLVIPALCLLACVIGCSSSAAFDPVGTWVYDFAASSADPANAGHTEDLEEMRDNKISFTLAADDSATVSVGGPPREGTYVVGDTTVNITADGYTLTFTVQGLHLTIPNPNSDTGMPLFYFSKQP